MELLGLAGATRVAVQLLAVAPLEEWFNEHQIDK
jgi:hypothetical protein